ncbi:Acyl carrier protein (ACP) [Macleaya cordata]|uniref:Acyl carrier protein n=1 Tax=Macleaya cordata TaxID=56857 RepID=A0A200Q688_MACCD|nr:Acyl carrier protein (ACP) [Macleaya cordata]
MQQALRTGIHTLRSSILSHCSNGAERTSILGFIEGARVFSSQSAAASSSPANFLGKEEVTTRVVDLLKSIPFVDPAKVSPTANFKNDLQMDMLDNVGVMMAVEEEFALNIPDDEANKFSTTAHLIDYISTHPQAK